MNNKGFSLIELSIALIVIGLLVTPLIQQYNVLVKRKNYEGTGGAMDLVESAMNDFLQSEGRYPCPADITLASSDVNIGVFSGADNISSGEEACPPALPDANGPAIGACVDGICRAAGRDADGVPGGDSILIGGVPYATLGITEDQTHDGWNRKLTYVVTESMTNGAYNEDWGAISVQDENAESLISEVDSQSYLLVSHGINGLGGHTVQGVQVGPCANEGFEIENCDNDNIFVEMGDRGWSLVEGPDYSDDIIAYNFSVFEGIWSLAADPEDIKTNTIGNVGIGEIDPQHPLDVKGDIKAVKTHADEYCNTEGAGGDCFEPSVIGTDGIECSGDDQAMTGIANNDSVCDLALPTTIVKKGDGTCAPGEFIKGISAEGEVQCSATP